MSGSAPAGPAPRGRLLATALAIAVVTALVWWPALEGGFVDYDDGAYVTKNPEVAAGLTPEGLRWAFVETHSANWHPLTWLSHMLDVELHGLEPRGHHLTAVLLHAANAALCLLALVALTRRLGASLVVALLFALHPLRVESVAWIAERKDVLSGTFFFLVLWAHARWARDGSRLAWALGLAALALGLLAKQMLVTVPFLLLVLDVWPLGRYRRSGPPGIGRTARRLVLEKLPHLGLCLAAGLATLAAQGAQGAVSSFDRLPLAVRLANAAVAYVAYLGKALWPVDLAVYYPHPWLVAPQGFRVLGPAVVGSAALLAAATAGLVLLARRGRPAPLAGWLWYVGTALPVIGIVQVGGQWMADRYAYLPHVGLYVAVVFGLDGLLRGRTAGRVALAAGIALALLCVPVTRAQIGVWRSTRTLFEHALAVTERNYVAHQNLGFLEHNLGDLDAAEEHYRAALAIAPNLPDAHSNLGAVRLARGDFPEAEEELLEALRLDPDFVQALLLLAVLREEQNDPEGRLEAATRAAERAPESPEAQAARGAALVAAGRAEEAARVLAAHVEAFPNQAPPRLALARALLALGREEEARDELERLLRRRPDATEGRIELVELYATGHQVRDPRRALVLAAELGAEAGRDWRALRASALAHAANDRADLALQAIVQAQLSAPPEERSALVELRDRLRAGESIHR